MKRWVIVMLFFLLLFVASTYFDAMRPASGLFLFIAIVLWRANTPRPFITIKK